MPIRPRNARTATRPTVDNRSTERCTSLPRRWPARPAGAPHAHKPQVSAGESGQGFTTTTTGPYVEAARAAFADAWQTQPVDMGIGGSIPFIAQFAEAFPDATILVTGVEDPDTRAHGADESLHVPEFAHVALAEAVLLERIGALGSGPGTGSDTGA